MNQAQNSMLPLLSCKGISYTYHRDRVLDGVDLELKVGELCAIIGPNGGGKSTFGKIIAGLLKPQKGSIHFHCDKFVGYVPQDTSLNKDFPIRAIDVVLMGFLNAKPLNNHINQERKEYAYALLERLGIKKLAKRRIGDLSGGERQRVLIARALAGDPRILLLDEPTASVDAPTQREIYQFLQELSHTRGVIIISHDVSLLLGYATKALYINRQGVMHTLEDIRGTIPAGHMCEVEFLQAFTEYHKGTKRDV